MLVKRAFFSVPLLVRTDKSFGVTLQKPAFPKAQKPEPLVKAIASKGVTDGKINLSKEKAITG